jgi:hypothetical protein
LVFGVCLAFGTGDVASITNVIPAYIILSLPISIKSNHMKNTNTQTAALSFLCFHFIRTTITITTTNITIHAVVEVGFVQSTPVVVDDGTRILASCRRFFPVATVCFWLYSVRIRH